MMDLVSFIEKETKKKVNLFEYKNEKLKDNQEIITFNNNLYVIEMYDYNKLSVISGYYYLVYQTNTDFNMLKSVFYNLYEEINLIEYRNYLLINSDIKLNINHETIEIIESETYSKTYIFDFDKINRIQTLDSKLNLLDELLSLIVRNFNSNKILSTNDLVLYKNFYILSTDKSLCNLINFENLKNIDESLLQTGVNFIENNLNISKTSSALFLHRNTLIYRLEKIKEILDLDLKNFHDAMFFYIIINTYFISKNT